MWVPRVVSGSSDRSVQGVRSAMIHRNPPMHDENFGLLCCSGQRILPPPARNRGIWILFCSNRAITE